MQNRKAFTLIELLVVISIIALLIAILLPVLSNVRYESANFMCLSRQRQFAIATTAYCTDNKDLYPDRGIDNNRSEPLWARWAARMWIDKNVDDNLDVVLGDYMDKDIAVWCCPQYDGAHGSGRWPAASSTARAIATTAGRPTVSMADYASTPPATPTDIPTTPATAEKSASLTSSNSPTAPRTRATS